MNAAVSAFLLKMIHGGYSRSYFNLFLIYAVARNACKQKPSQIRYENSFDSSKDRLDTKILRQFSKLQDKKPFVRPFLSPKNLILTSHKLYTQVLLVGTFAVRANGYCYVFREITRLLKFFRVVNIENAGFSKLETRFSRFETRFVRVSSILPVLSRHAITCSQTLYFLFNIYVETPSSACDKKIIYRFSQG